MDFTKQNACLSIKGAGLLLFIGLLAGCQSDDNIHSPVVYLKRSSFGQVEKYSLASDLATINRFLLYPRRVYLYNDLLFITDKNNRNGSILVFDKVALKPRKAFGELGPGPGQFESIQNLAFGRNYLFVYDMTGNKIVYYHTDSLLTQKNYTFGGYLQLQDHRNIDFDIINDTTFIISIYGGANRLRLIDRHGNTLSAFLSYPPLANKYHTPAYDFRYQVKANIYQSKISVNPQKNRLVMSHSFTSLLQLIDLETGQLLKNIVGPDKNFPPEYKLTQDGRSYVPKDYNLGYLAAIIATENFVYILYHGKPFGNFQSNEIFKFDWNGNPISRILLDKEVYFFAVDEANEAIYGIQEEDPQLLLFKKHK